MGSAEIITIIVVRLVLIPILMILDVLYFIFRRAGRVKDTRPGWASWKRRWTAVPTRSKPDTTFPAACKVLNLLTELL